MASIDTSLSVQQSMVRSWWVRWLSTQCDGRRGERGSTTRLSLDGERRGAMSQQHGLPVSYAADGYDAVSHSKSR